MIGTGKGRSLGARKGLTQVRGDTARSGREIPLTSRIGAAESLPLGDCQIAVRAPFDQHLQAFLDMLYCDGRQAGVRSTLHAQVLLRRWLDLSVAHDPAAATAPYFTALRNFYPPPRSLRKEPRTDVELSRREAEAAMRAPFEKVLGLYLERLFDPNHPPGIRNDAHARETFATFCALLHAYKMQHGRD